MKYKNELYILIYKQKYRLHNKNVVDLALVFKSIYRTTNVNDVVQDFIIESKYTTIKSISTLSTIKKFLRNYKQNIVNVLSLTHIDYYIIYKSNSQKKEHYLSFDKKNNSKMRKMKSVIDFISQKLRKTLNALSLFITYRRKTRQKFIEFDLLNFEKKFIKFTTKISGSFTTSLKRKANISILFKKTLIKSKSSDKIIKIHDQIFVAMTFIRKSTLSSFIN